jgi:hypothetical protein
MRAQKMPKPDGWAWWQVVWANIWNAVLAGKWLCNSEVPLCGEPVPEVLLSRLP